VVRFDPAPLAGVLAAYSDLDVPIRLSRARADFMMEQLIRRRRSVLDRLGG